MRNCNNNTLFAGCSFCSLQYERDMNISLIPQHYYKLNFLST